jgi:hypothetical protein
MPEEMTTEGTPCEWSPLASIQIQSNLYTGVLHDGIDEMDVHVESTPPITNTNKARATRAKIGKSGQHNDLVMASIPPNATPADDYDSKWFLRAHPSTFPHNKGACPEGMTLDNWCRTLLHRYPMQQFAQNLPLVCDSFNITQRHSVNKNAWIQFRCSPDRVRALTSLNEADVTIVISAIEKKLVRRFVAPGS